MKKKFYIGGMSCSACSAAVERAVSSLEGAIEVNVNLLGNSMTAEYDDEMLNEDKIILAVKKAGYSAEIYSASNERKRQEENSKKEIGSLRKRIVFSAILLLILMYISMGHMLSLPLPSFLINNKLLFAIAQFDLAAVVCIINYKYYFDGFRSLFKGHPNMNSLIAIGSGAAMIYGIFALGVLFYAVRNNQSDVVEKYIHQLYFESAAMILTLVTLGKYLESKAKARTNSAVEKLLELSPKTARVEIDGKERTIPTEKITLGNIVLIKAGESVPVDGIVLNGNASLDTSAITGESLPQDVKKGDKIVSGSVSTGGFIKIKATAVGEDTTLAEIVALVEQAGQSKAPIAKLADKISGVFVPIVIAVAVVSTVIWLLVGKSAEFSLSIGISVLVISCPCALGLATPVAIMVASGVGAQHGVLIKSAEILESIHKTDTVVLDKTGTVTEGKPFVTEIFPLNCSAETLLGIAYSLEKNSEHPISNAIKVKFEESKLNGVACTQLETFAGKGVGGIIKDKQFYAGNMKLMEEKSIDTEEIKNIASSSQSSVFISDENKILGIIYIGDKIKSDSKTAVENLNKMGIETYMLTGDNQLAAESIAKQAGIKKVISDVLPQQKEKCVSKLKESGKFVVMVGDGINDAPALTAADVGIAIGNGTDIAIESADVVLTRNKLSDVVTAIKLSKTTLKNIKMNLFWALFYNSVGIPLAAGLLYPFFGLTLNPMFAAAAMSLSSVCVVLNALRLNFFKE